MCLRVALVCCMERTAPEGLFSAKNKKTKKKSKIRNVVETSSDALFRGDTGSVHPQGGVSTHLLPDSVYVSESVRIFARVF